MPRIPADHEIATLSLQAVGSLSGDARPECYAACFESAIQLVASKEEVDVTGATVTANVDIGYPPGGGIALKTELIGACRHCRGKRPRR